MFWANNYVSSPHIEALLNKEDVTLYELMDEEDILQECKSQNKKLIEYLTRSNVLEELVTLTTKEPPTDIEERWRYKYPNVACELLTCVVPSLNEKLAGDETLLAKLYSFIDTDQPLNPLLASFFSKTIGVLVARKSDQVLEFLKSRQTFVDLLLQHLETSAIMDLILKLVTDVEGSDMRQNILNWLDSQQLVQRLVKLLSPSSEPAKHANAAQLLCDIITDTRESQRTCTERTDPDPILNTLETGETVSLLLETILTGEKLESSIVGGIQVLLVLLGRRANNMLIEGDVHDNGAGDEVADKKQRTKISNATLPYLEQLHKLLLDPPYKPAVKTTAGVLECPLGNTRLHIAKLLMALLSAENVEIHKTLVELGTFQILIDLFFKYAWNNFLHTQVQQCLALAINCDFEDTNDIYSNIFIKCKLIDRILEAWDGNDSKQSKENGVRQGYMGHLINIANNIVSQCEKCGALDKFLKSHLSAETLSKWETLVNTQLAKINKTHHIVLGEQTQVYMKNSEENPDEYNSYSQEFYIQQIYYDYQGQQMTPQFIENFGFRYDQFSDGDEGLHNPVGELTTLAFTLSEEDLDEQEDMFNKMCREKQKRDPDSGNSGFMWGADEGDLTFQTVVETRDGVCKPRDNDCNSSDEEDQDDDTRDIQMENDTTDPWDATEPPTSNATLPEVNPWDVPLSEPVESTGWANFDNFESTLNIENTVIVDNKLSDEMKKETSEQAVDSNKKETSEQAVDPNKKETDVENKVSVESIGGGDTKTGDSVGSTSCTEANLDNKSTENSLIAVSSSDKNANPQQVFGNSETETGGTETETKDAAEKENKMESDKLSSDYKNSCSIKTTSPENVLAAKDAK